MFPDIAISNNLDDLADGHSLILTGTGWASDLEHQARIIAKLLGRQTIAVLDHWVNYEDRFERTGIVQRPDEIWVFDKEAQNLAQSTFSQCIITQKRNYYWETQAGFSAKESLYEYLYISEPARNDWGKGRPGEFQALDFFMKGLEKGALSGGHEILFRLHPSETAEKYAEAFESFQARGMRIEVDQNPELGASVARAKQVVGCASAALAFALYVGKRVISVLPPNAPPCCLPHAGLLHLREALANEVL
jgi:hypothetical protein